MDDPILIPLTPAQHTFLVGLRAGTDGSMANVCIQFALLGVTTLGTLHDRDVKVEIDIKGVAYIRATKTPT